jgi:hypothetical protein
MSEMTPGERRELRALTKKQFAVLRAEVKRRTEEMKSEVETELLRRYRSQDQAVAAATAEVDELTRDVGRQLRAIADRLTDLHPELQVEVGISYNRLTLRAGDPTRAQLHRAAIDAIPTKIANAATRLDQQELDLLRDLTVGALTTDEAQAFLARIPTVGVLVPTARLPEIEWAEPDS